MKLYKKISLMMLALMAFAGPQEIFAADGQQQEAAADVRVPTDDEAGDYFDAVFLKFTNVIKAIRTGEDRGLNEATAGADLQQLFAVPHGTLISMYREQVTQNCDWEKSNPKEWVDNSFRRMIFSALMMVLYEKRDSETGNLVSVGLFRAFKSAIVTHLNHDFGGDSLELSRTGIDPLSKFFMELTKIDAALLAAQSDGKIRIDRWMEDITKCWHVPAVYAQTDAEREAEEEIRRKTAERTKEAGRSYGSDDPDGILSVKKGTVKRVFNDGEVRVVGRPGSVTAVGLEDGAEVYVVGRPGSVTEVGLEDGAEVYIMDRNGPLRVYRPRGRLRQLLPGLAAALSYVVFEGISRGEATLDGALMTTFAACAVQGLSRLMK